ncbi:MAG: Fic family protein [Phycisphaerae bacterium]|nr:Fic family protein [Phycisphaerae bacterium]
MDFWTPDQIALDAVTSSLLNDVTESASRVSDYRPLPSEVVRRIEEHLVGERVYSSNAIEGNTLDLRETVMVLRQGYIDANRRRESLEARNLGQAVDQVTQWIGQNVDCYSTPHLLDVHRLLLIDVNDEWAGRLRDHRVLIQGARRQPPDHSVVPGKTDLVMEVLRSRPAVHGVTLAAWAHWAIARIHPFHDANGRAARLWQDLVLLREGLTCGIIRPADRIAYLEALGQADEGHFDALVQLLSQRVLSTFDRYLTEIDQATELDRFVMELVDEADTRAVEREQLAYERWSRKMQQLRWEFDTCASRISDASRSLAIQVRHYDLIDRAAWNNIRLGRGAGKTWFFVAEFHVGPTSRRYFFFFGKHYWSDLDTDEERSGPRVCLLVSEERTPGEAAVRLDEGNDPAVTLREVFVVDNRLVRKRYNPAADACEYDRDVPALRIAQDFLREVILHRMA